jgi:hypothetical protein
LSTTLLSKETAGRGIAVATSLTGAHTHDVRVDGAGNAVLQLKVQLRQLVSYFFFEKINSNKDKIEN